MNIEHLQQHNRKSDINLKRQALCYYLFEYKNLNYFEIAAYIKRNRTTVIHNIKTFKQRLKTEENSIKELNEIKKQNVNLDFIIIEKFIEQNKTKISGKLLNYLNDYNNGTYH